MAKKSKKKPTRRDRPIPRKESISEAMSTVELMKADGTIVQANASTKVKLTEEQREDLAWYLSFHDPDPEDITLESLGMGTYTTFAQKEPLDGQASTSTDPV